MNAAYSPSGSRRFTSSIGAALLMLASACFDVPLPTIPGSTGAVLQRMAVPATSFHSVAPANPDDANSDDEDARVAREVVPGYAGVLTNDDGSLTLLLADTGQGETKRAFIESQPNVRGRGQRITKQRMVRYNFDELKGAFDLIRRSGLAGGQWVMRDIDEANNRILIGVPTNPDIPIVTAAAQRLGLPTSMFSVELRPPLTGYVPAKIPIPCDPATDPSCVPPPPPPSGPPPTGQASGDVLASTPYNCVGLRCNQPYLVGGLEIMYSDPTNAHWYACTLGALMKVDYRIGFITASHCSTAGAGRNDGTRFIQGGNSGTIVGQKLIDPAFTYSGCYAGYVCRASDVQFVDILYNRPLYVSSYLAKPTFEDDRDTLRSPLLETLVGYHIVNERRPPQKWLNYGDNVAKIGRTTGYTTGMIINTCADVTYGATTTGVPLEFTCQMAVGEATGWPATTILADRGDSGGPVFLYAGGLNVSLEGFVGSVYTTPKVGTSSNQYVFSPFFSAVNDIRRVAGSGATVTTLGAF